MSLIDDFEYADNNYKYGFLKGYILKMAEDISIKLHKDTNINYIAFDMDIFYIGQNKELTLKDILTDELNIKYDFNFIENIIGNYENINYFNIGEMFYQSLIKFFDNKEINYDKFKELGNEIKHDLKYIFGSDKKISVYSIKELDNNKELVLQNYLYIVFDCIAIKIDDYYLLLIIGSNE